MQQRFRLHAAVTPGPCLPVPLESPDSQRNHIIFQFVGLLPGKASHAAPEVTKHRLAGKILNNQIQRCPEEFHKGIHQHRMFLVDKARNPRLPEDLPGVSGVRRKIPGKHRDVTVTISVHTDQLMNFCRHRPQLLLRIHRHTDRQFSFRISAPLIPVITIQILLQKIQSASFLKPAVFSPLRPDLRKNLTMYFMGAVQKLPHHLPAGEKQILGAGASHRIFPLIDRHRHQKLRTERHQFFQHLQLDRRKSHKTVKKNFTGPDLLRLLQPDGQNLENPFRRHVAVPQIFLERLVNTADILQFQRQQRFCLCPFSPELQILSRHLILHQLRNQRFHLCHGSMPLQILAQHLQILLLLLGDSLDHQSFSRLRQQRTKFSPGLLKNPVGKTLKTQNINIQNASVRMHGSNRFLRLHRKLFRHHHQKSPFRMAHGLFYHVAEPILRFSRAGIPENKL